MTHILFLLLLVAGNAIAQCEHENAEGLVNEQSNAYKIRINNVLLNADCEDGWVLFADFGRERSQLTGLFGQALSHRVPLIDNGWEMSRGIKFFDDNLNTPDSALQFYVTGEKEGELIIDWIVGWDTVKTSVRNHRFLIGKRNAIYFRTPERDILLWEEGDKSQEDIVLSDLSQYGDGKLVFVERSGTFWMNEIWAK